MTYEQPDPRTLGSWGDAFQYPIPVVRRWESQLRGEIASNKEKLRTLVGASYRELLGTAERIVGMDEQIHAVESNLVTVGRHCNSRAVERKSENFALLQHNLAVQDHHLRLYPLVSQLALLHKFSRAISHILRSRGSTLLAAKILVISRLVHKSLLPRKNAPPFLETLRNKLASQRRSLLRNVDQQLASPQASADSLVEAMCAFCLATSSSSSDALRHFLHVQLDGIRTLINFPEDISKNMLKTLRIYIQAQRTTRALFPRRLAEALASFRSHPLLAHPDILQLHELDLDIHSRWIEGEVRNFTPWIKSDSIPKTEMERITGDWERQAFGSFMSGLITNLKEVTDFRELIGIRRSLLDTWLPAHYSLSSPSSNVLDGLRKAINARLLDQIQTQSEKLGVVGSRISSALASWKMQVRERPKPLWDGSLIDMDYSNGGTALKQEIVNRSHGRDPTVLQILKPYNDYLLVIRNTEHLIQDLKSSHWDDSFDEEEEDVAVESMVSLLNEEDPRLLEEELTRDLRQSFESFHSSIQDTLGKVRGGAGGEVLGFMIRLLREIGQSMPESVSVRYFGLETTTDAHRMLAAEICKGASLSLKRSVEETLGNRHVVGRLLWEGDPALPVQPSPASFKLLRQTTLSMSDYGTDLWNPVAVEILKAVAEADVTATFRELTKEHAGDQLVNGLKSKIEEGATGEAGSEKGEENTNGATAVNRSEQSPDRAEMFRDANIQLLFDACYLQAAFAGGEGPEKPSEGLAAFVTELSDGMHLGEPSVERLQRAAMEYWKRTKLLFGLLVA